MALSIYLYVPNLIGYARILINVAAFAHAFSDKAVFVSLYLLSFVLDYFDGLFARLLKQSSTLGQVLDMVTDSLTVCRSIVGGRGRVSTAALLVVLTHLYKSWFGVLVLLLGLDIASHWLQMFSSLLSSKLTHKDVADNESAILRLYYTFRPFMGYCCIGAEVFYLSLYLLDDPYYHKGFSHIPIPSPANNCPFSIKHSILVTLFLCSLSDVDVPALHSTGIVALLAYISLPGCLIKQLVNIAQAKSAADAIVQFDINKRRLKARAE
eukprot:SM000103S09476  [mRNA]  locus=s103:110662:114147:- [translate_table: standard]